MKIEIPIMQKEEVRKEILKRTKMPKWGWLDITDGINLKFDPYLLAGAMVAILQKFYERGIRNIDVLVTCEASGNVLAVLGALVAKELGIANPGMYGLTFRKTEIDEIPMFDLYGQIKSASHGNKIQTISTIGDFLARKRVLMLDDVLRDGKTAGTIKELVEKVGGTFLGLGAIFRKGWLKKEQLKNIDNTEIFSLIDVPSSEPKAFKKFKQEIIKSST